MEKELEIQEEDEPSTPIGIIRSRQSSMRSQEVQQQQQALVNVLVL